MNVSIDTHTLTHPTGIASEDTQPPNLSKTIYNKFEYQDAKDAACQRLKLLLEALKGACDKAGVRPVSASLADITDKVLALPPVITPLVCEGAVFDADAKAPALAA